MSQTQNTFTITITGKIGPGNTLTSYAFTNVVGFEYNNNTGVLKVNKSDGTFSYITYAGATWTVTCSGGVVSAMSMTA